MTTRVRIREQHSAAARRGERDVVTLAAPNSHAPSVFATELVRTNRHPAR